jgi:DMSO/TMAO reductase YedYZ molybdopterin-dependent catalytic subunit
MALYVVRHQHVADRCPAQDPFMGAKLLNYLSRPNARQHGLQIQGEAVVQGQHTFYLIVEAEDEAGLRAFMQPFEQAGSVEIYQASTCARVVASGGCAEPLPSSDFVPALDPGEACQEAIDAGLVVHRAHPLNCETSLPALIGGVVMPSARFYVRNHFQIPTLDPATFRLKIGGLVERPVSLALRDLQQMRSQTMVVTLECAGNGRTLFEPAIDGEKWAMGAVSTAEWTGVPLAEVLDRVGTRPGACEVVFRGADCGTVDRSELTRFGRSLQLDDARGEDVLLAYAMNGEPLPVQHGYPLRLIVPRWYAVASVKWLTEIDVINQPFTGHYQSEKYWYEWERDGTVVREPVSLQQVRALITDPDPAARVRQGELAIRGVAWSGAAAISRVEVSVDGSPWQPARLVGERSRYSWQWWELITQVERKGSITIRARATDFAGRVQPERAEWNRLGYGNNTIHDVPIEVV